MKKRFVILMLFFVSVGSLMSQTTYYVSTFSGLTTAISSAATGDIIEIQNDLTTTTPASGFSAVVISKALTINGNDYTITVPVTGVSDAGINNTGSGGTSTASAYRVLEISGSVTITINNWKIKGGNIGSNGSGGCILNSATKLVLNYVTISNGRSSYSTSGVVQLGNGGGGISNSGNLYLNNCLLTRNSAGYGGGFLNNAGKIFIDKSTITENRSEYSTGGGGGGENKGGGLLYINNTTFSNNYSTELGGAINNYQSTIYCENSTFTGNVCYGDYPGGAISNRNVEYFINCIFAYNYYRSAGTTASPTTFSLDDFAYSTGSNVNSYYSIYHSSNNKFNTSTSVSNIQYTGAADGSDNTIFAGGIYTKITDGTGTEIGTGKVYQPLLITNTATKTATLKIGSFPNNSSNKGVVTGYTDGSGTPSFGYKNPSTGSWVNILGSAASSNVVTKDQLNNTRSTTAPTRGAVESESASIYMLKSVSTANGSTTGASIYGDVYTSGTKVNVTAAANTGYAFSYWKDYTTGSTLSSSNPYTITLTSNLTIQPVFITSSTYTVTYLGNSNTSGSAGANQTFTTGNSVTISNQNTLLRDEYYFSGWNTQPSGGGTNYAVGATYSTTANLTLYAKWTPYIKYYVKSGSTTALNSTSSWSGYPDGTGGSPANFNSDKIFILDNSANSTSFSTGGNWTVAGALQIPTGKTLSIDNNTTLSIAGDIFNSGSISSGGSNAVLKMVGSGAQYLAGSNNIAKLTIENSNGVEIGGVMNITNSLTLTSGVLTTGGYVTLKSNSTGTAIVNQVTGGSVSGSVVVERYIPARRAYRLLSSPVTTTTSINANWQEGGSNTSGIGTHITGSTSGSNGFDQTQTGNNSLYTHNNSTGSWSAVSNTNSNTLTAGNPYRLMVRGDRTVDLSTNTPTPTNTTLRATGTLYVGTLAVSGLSQSANGFSFIGNPYQAPVDMNAILTASTNLNTNFYYIWDPKVSTRGAYVTVDVANNSNNVSGSAADKYLQPWQACFVKTVSSGSAALSFTEASKGTSLTSVFKLLPPLSTWNIQLYQSDSLNVDAMPSDGLILRFDSKFSNSIDQLDALKPVNQDENLAVKNTDQLLSIESRNTPGFLDTIPLYFYQIRDKKYVFKFDITANVGRKAYLIDKYLNLEYPIEQSGITSYSFEVDQLNTSSKDPNRFAIVFKEEVLAVSSILANSKYLSITPNPVTNNKFKITHNRGFELGNVLEIIDMNGKTIYKTSISASGNECLVDLQGKLVSGVYCVKLSTGNSVETKTLLVD